MDLFDEDKKDGAIVIPHEPFGGHDRFEPDETDCWAKWESKSKTMEADLQARLIDRADRGSPRRLLSTLAQMFVGVVQFFSERRS